MIFLNQHGVEQSGAMVGRAAGADRILLQRSQRRRRLAGIEDRDSPAAGLDEPPRPRGDAAEALEKIERRAFTNEERPRRSLNRGQLVASAAEVAVVAPGARAHVRIELPERLERHVDAGKHAVALHHEHAARLLPGGHRRVGGDVTVANVFVERATDGVDEHLAFEWLQLDCMCGHLRTLDFIQACGTGSYPSTTISRGSPALTANA